MPKINPHNLAYLGDAARQMMKKFGGDVPQECWPDFTMDGGTFIISDNEGEWFDALKKVYNIKMEHGYHCAHCGKPFTSLRARTHRRPEPKYCGTTCRVSAHRKAMRDELKVRNGNPPNPDVA